MAEDFRLSAENRELLGSANTRRLRKQGRVPANLYGFQKESVNVSVLAEDIEKLVAAGSRVVDVAVDGSVEKAVVRELQWDIYSTHVKHVDLLRVDPEAETTVDVPLVLRGEPIGLKDGGQLRQLEKKVTVTCPEIRVPKNIVVRVAPLKVGDSVKVSDLAVPDSVEINTASDTVVAELFDPKKPAPASE
ncbi:MAG: 50S ribosomal protein L25 [Fuerstiella sp.]|nr:50S ribosomal protein L25 [Fuerstiella sp.]MCP4510736.1 50S ribosomal protein L25 [Fuerstiella sp.]MDG2127327.1 50S ribosomal protein L25 [Fuerstiella sp.]